MRSMRKRAIITVILSAVCAFAVAAGIIFSFMPGAGRVSAAGGLTMRIAGLAAGDTNLKHPVTGNAILSEAIRTDVSVTLNSGDHGKISQDGASFGTSLTATVEQYSDPSSNALSSVEYAVDAGWAATGFEFNATPVSIASGMLHTAVVLSDGTLWLMGDNSVGQFGMAASTSPETSFIQGTLQDGTPIENAVSVACGKLHTVVLLDDGRVLVAGDNSRGQLGSQNGEAVTQYFDFAVDNNGVIEDAIAVSAYYTNTYIIRDAGGRRMLYCAGDNSYGKLGVAKSNSVVGYFCPAYSAETGNYLTDVVSVAGGSAHTMLVTADGKAYGAGRNNYGQLGLGVEEVGDTRDTGAFVESKKTLDDNITLDYFNDAVSVACGDSHTVVLTRGGKIYSGGLNDWGQLSLQGGGSDTSNAGAFTRSISNRTDDLTGIVSVACDTDATFILTEDGVAYCAGNASRCGASSSSFSRLEQFAFGIVSLTANEDALFLADPGGTIRSVSSNEDKIGHTAGELEPATVFNPLKSRRVSVKGLDYYYANAYDTTFTVTYEQIAMSLVASTVTYGNNQTLTATLSGAGFNGDVNHKEVEFYDGSTKLGSATTNASGVAVYPVSIPSAGNHSYKAIHKNMSDAPAHVEQTVTGTVNKKDITIAVTPNGGTYGGTITGATASSADIVGSDDPAYAYTYSGTANDGTVYTNATTVPTKAGTYTVKAAVTNANYTGEQIADFTVNKKSIAISVTPNGGTYGEAITGATASSADIVNSDDPAYAYTYSGTASDGTVYTNSTTVPTQAGTYTVKAAVTNANYTGEQTADFTVNKKSITIAVTPNGGTYGETITGATASSDDIVNTDDPSYAYTYNGTASDGTVYTNSTTVPTQAGTYTVKAAVTNANYTGEQTEEFTVAKKSIAIAVTPNGGTYGETITGATASSDDIVNTDDPSYAYTYSGTANDGTVYTNSTTVPTQAGTYTVKAAVTNANYTGEQTEEFIVAKGTPTVNAQYTTPGVIYTSGSLPAISLSEGDTAGAIAWDTYTLSVSKTTYEWTFVPTDTANYNGAVGVSGAFTIEAATLVSITVTSNSKTEYNALEQLSDADVVVMATYNDGNSKQIHSGAGGYTVRYADGERFHAGDTQATIVFTDGSITREVAVGGLTVARLNVARPELTGEYVYNGGEQSVSITHNAADYATLYTVSGDTATAAGTHSVTFTLTNARDYTWTDGDGEALTLDWTIAQARLSLPTLNGSYEYNGGAITAALDGLPMDATLYAVTNNEKTEAGDYALTVTLFDDNYAWEGTDSRAVDVDWSIEKATPTVNAVYDADTQLYTSGSLPAISLGEGDTAGTIAWDKTDLSAEVSVYGWTFTPTDAKNYKTVTGTATFTVLESTLSEIKLAGDIRTEYTALEELDKTGLTVTAKYADNASKEVFNYILSYENGACFHYGDTKVTVSYTDGAVTKTADITVSVSRIVVTEAEAPTVTGEYVYSGATQTPEITANAGYALIAYVGEFKNADEYTMEIELTSDDYEWWDGTRDNKTVTFVIAKQVLEAPESQQLPYVSGNSVTAYEETETYTVNGGTNMGVGEYTASFTLKDAANYAWADTDSQTVAVVWHIIPKEVTAPTISGEYTYTGSEQTAVFDHSDSSLYAGWENVTATEAGTYEIEITLNDPVNYKWADSEGDAITIVWTIKGATPTVNPVFDTASRVYTGTGLPGIELSAGDTAGTVAWDATEITAGKRTYTWTFTPEDSNYGTATGEYEFTVTQSAVTGLRVTQAAERSEYTAYDAYETQGLELTVTYNDGRSLAYTDGFSVEYASGDCLHYGDASVTVRYGELPSVVVSGFSVAKLTVDAPTITGEYTYNGAVQSAEIATSEHYTVNGGEQTNAATHAVTVTLNDPANCEWSDGKTDALTLQWTIAKAVYDMSGVKFADVTATYNGESHNAQATDLPSGVTVTYENNGQTNAGTYTVTAKFAGDAANYELIGDMTATLTIDKAVYDMSGVNFGDATVTYNGESHSLEVTELPAGVTVTYEGNDRTNAGTYTVTAKFSGDAANYELIEDMAATLTVNKATYDMSGVKFENATVTYNGESHSLEVTGLPAGVTVTYENNGKTNAGTYTVTAKFRGDADNYEFIADMTATLTVNKAKYDMSGVKFENATVTYNGESHSLEVTGLPAGVTVTYEGNGKTEAGTYTVTAKFSGNANYEAIADMTATLTIEAEAEKGGCSCGGVITDVTTIVLISVGVLLFGAVFAVKKLRNKKK